MFAPAENWMAATWSYGGNSNTTPSAIERYALSEPFETSDFENPDRCNLVRLNLRF